jgi:hypothetical protein
VNSGAGGLAGKPRVENHFKDMFIKNTNHTESFPLNQCTVVSSSSSQ